MEKKGGEFTLKCVTYNAGKKFRMYVSPNCYIETHEWMYSNLLRKFSPTTHKGKCSNIKKYKHKGILGHNIAGEGGTF
jgi:hypothetical protein